MRAELTYIVKRLFRSLHGKPRDRTTSLLPMFQALLNAACTINYGGGREPLPAAQRSDALLFNRGARGHASRSLRRRDTLDYHRQSSLARTTALFIQSSANIIPWSVTLHARVQCFEWGTELLRLVYAATETVEEC